MDGNDERYKQLQESLQNMQGQFHVLETSVPIEKQMEYFRYSENVRKKEKDSLQSIEESIQNLNSTETSEEGKKYAMTLLAISEDVKAYRALEAYTLNSEENLKDWARMSFLQAKITLESGFLEEKQIFISTGLGGKGDMLRFFAFVKSTDLLPFSPYQIQLIKKELPFFINKKQGHIEELKVFENYFTLIFLINIKVDIKKIIENVLAECNQYGDFIDQSFIITNVKIFSEDEIQKELKRNSQE